MAQSDIPHTVASPARDSAPAAFLDEVERDIRNLMSGLANAQFALGDLESKQAEQTKRLLLDLIGVADAFERVFRTIGTKEGQVTNQVGAWLESFRIVQSLLEAALSAQGVVRMENLARRFDPHDHTVAKKVADQTKPEGTIVEIDAPGYVWRDQVLRKPQVVVVYNLEAPGKSRSTQK